MNSKNLTHLAIIMDGNSRWAKIKGKPLIEGYYQGVNALRNIIKYSIQLEIKYITAFAFSTENWNRDQEEVEMLMDLIRYFIQKDLPDLIRDGIRVRVIGEREDLALDIQELIKDAEAQTSVNQKLHLTIALNYGSQQEIIKAVQNIADEVQKGKIKREEIDIKYFTNFLYTKSLPSLDLLIRTSGEIRLSNFLLWQAAYAELYFTDTLWPDFSYEELLKAVDCYNNRDRRYGKSNVIKINK